jgi:hypothetical protein
MLSRDPRINRRPEEGSMLVRTFPQITVALAVLSRATGSPQVFELVEDMSSLALVPSAGTDADCLRVNSSQLEIILQPTRSQAPVVGEQLLTAAASTTHVLRPESSDLCICNDEGFLSYTILIRGFLVIF